jgi:hypothetical protein
MSNITHVAADAVAYGGVIREDVMDKIWDISSIPLPFTELCSKGSHSNRRVEFVTDELDDPSTSNAEVEGADQTKSDGKLGARLGNYTQIATKGLKVTDTSEQANGIGNINRLSYQLAQRQKELRRDVEAQMLTHQASVAGDANTVAGISAGIGAQLKSNVNVGATGVVGGFNTTTGLFVAPVPGTPRALSEKTLRDVLQSVYEAGGNTSLAMARPVVIRALSEYLFTDTARVATISSEKAQNSPSALTAYGSVNVFVTDFGQTIQLRDNRLQQPDGTNESSLYLLDPAHLKQSFLRGYTTEPLAKNGLSERRQISVQYSLLVLNEASQGAILAIDETAAVVA